MSLRLTYCYRSDSPAIIAAKLKDNDESMVMDMQSKEFAARFGAVPVFSMGPVPHFVGIAFKKDAPPQHKALWASLKQGDPRSVLKPQKAVPKKLMKEWEELITLWTDNFPHDVAKPRESHLITALGHNMQMIQGHGMNYFFHKGVSWVMCTLTLDEPFVEVKASEFYAANMEHQLHEAQLQMQVEKGELVPAQMIPIAGAANEEKSDG